MEPLLWSILLLIAALGLIALEIFIPSGGVLGILAALAVIASLAVAFTGGMMTGTIMMLVTIVLVPLVVAGAVRWWPHTPIGRLLVLGVPASEDEVLPDTPEYRTLGELVGKRGVAKTKMLPSGTVLIDGETHDALSDGMAVDAGQPIRVTAIRANRIVVVLDDSGDWHERDGGDGDELAQSAESLGLLSLEDPT
jgi:membrane-bound ClpP family serine protease